ncbi:hypothetical protein [Rhodococcoides kroppenstedtii]|uniref:hypothetical protein n=1 Tax=Rhodococcoides kroppenstedtii TaxID=293050 RepID=UPI0028E6E436|nr:hypothetical protein [Rhodococcus kroppenstedtii]
MAARKWYDNEAIDKWGTVVMVVALAIIGGPTIGNAIDDPTAWNVTLVVIWVAALASYATSMLRRRSRTGKTETRGAVDPAAVPVSDVTTAIADTTSRVTAVKRLREMHPGLSLGDAAHLVDGRRH